MRPYLKSWLVRSGLGILLGGSLPLILVGLAAELGLTDDPNPNPIGLGLLLMVTFWPGVICLLIGTGTVAARQRLERQRRDAE